MTRKAYDDSFASLSDKYIQYNFQRPDFIDAILTVLRDEDSSHPRIVALSGETGIGRHYLLESSAYLAQKGGAKVQVASINLDGYADEATSLEDYANHLLAKCTEQEKSRIWQAIKGTQLELKAKAGFAVCAFLSMAVSLKVPWEKLLGDKGDLSGPNRPGYELLDRLIGRLTRKAKLVVHITDNDLLADTWRRWLLSCLDRHDNLLLGFSCGSIHDFQRSISDRDFLPLVFGPLDRTTFRSIIDNRFTANTFPDAFHAVLWQYSHGCPADMARILKDLHAERLLYWDGKSWQLTGEDLESEEFVGVFAPAFYEPFDALRDELPSDMIVQLETFMQLAAMCGTYVPSNLLMRFMDLTLEDRDALGDLIDERLIESTDHPVFEDLEAKHPSFKQVSVYRWKNRTLRRVFCQQYRVSEQEKLATKLIAYLKSNLPVTSRGIARLFLELSRLLPTGRDVEFYHGYLAWWIGLDDATLLGEQLSCAINSGRLAPSVLWKVVAETRHTWPAYRRLAVLEAFSEQRSGVPYELREPFDDVKMELLHQLARYSDAEEICRAALARRERSLGSDHPDVAICLNNLAGLMVCQGRYDEAESFYRRALDICKDALAPDRLVMAISLDGFAGLLDHQSRYEEAEPFCRQALGIREEIQGANHLDTATNLRNLGEILHHQGKYGEAEPLCRRALDIKEGTLGPDHPDVATSLADLTELLRRQSGFVEAEPLCRKALAIREKTLGPDHPDVASSLRNLANLLICLGRYNEAEPLFRRALDICERILKPNHPEVANNLNDLATLLRHQSRYDEAEPLYRRALVVCEEVRGPGHHYVAIGLSNLAGVLTTRGRYDDAASLYKRALAILEKVLGADHPDVATCLRNLAELLFEQGRYDEAEPLCRKALAVHEEVLGPDHPDTATSMRVLAKLLSQQGKCDEAEPLCRRAVATHEKALGLDHLRLATSLRTLAEILGEQGRYDEGELLCRRALTMYEKVLGVDHPRVGETLGNLAHLLSLTSHKEEAESAYHQAIEILDKTLGPSHPTNQKLRRALEDFE